MPNVTVVNPPSTPEVLDTSAPGSIAVKTIDRKSDDWTRYHFAWDLMYWMYVGGVEIENQAEQFLKRRPKELSDVYQHRVETFVYQNHVGTAIDWYQAALFEKPPTIQPSIDPGDPAMANKKPEDLLKSKDLSFYERFSDNCDRAGGSFMQMMHLYFRNLITYGRAAMLVDLPKPGSYKSRFEEEQAGQFDPFLVNWDTRQMINFAIDSNGCLDWVVFSARETSKASPFQETQIFDRWYYYDRQNYAVYQRLVPADEKTAPDNALADRVAYGPHSMSAENVVPVIYQELPEGLWLMNRAYLACKDHLNTDNVHSFALKMAALAMPVIKCDGEYKLTLSEAGFIKLPLKSEYSWSEPEGKSFTHLANRALSVKEEIFRAFYLISQARTLSATAEQQSGASKEQDMMASKKVLNLFGSTMRNLVQRLRNMISAVREDGLMWDVRGLSFPENPPNEALDLVALAQVINVPSDTFEKECFKLAVNTVLPDANPALMNKILSEIDSSPDKLTRQVNEMQATAAASMPPGTTPAEQSGDQMVSMKTNKTNFKGL